MRMISPVVVIIPALNEYASIGTLIREIPVDVVGQVIVVDNGSTDDTAECARGTGALVVSEPERGYGRAVAAGVRALPDWAEIVVFLDGDGCDDPRLIPRLIEPVKDGAADFVLGSRTIGARDPCSLSLLQIVAGRCVGWVLGRLYGVSFSDMSPFRAVRRTALDALPMTEMTYGWNLQMMMLAAEQRLRIREIPVHSRCRSGGVSKVSGNPRVVLVAAMRILTVLVRTGRRGRRPSPSAFRKVTLP